MMPYGSHTLHSDDECQLNTQWLNQTDDHVERDYCIRKITQDMPTYFVETFDQQDRLPESSNLYGFLI